MTVANSSPLDLVALTSTPPGRHERAIAVVVVVMCIAILVGLATFARVPLPRIEAFIPTYESALAINDLITAVLLFGQFLRVRSLGLLILASGYLFDTLIIIPHALTFPGVFSPQGLLQAGPQTTAWLYCFWHGGFAVFVVFYAWSAHFSGGPVFRNFRLALIISILGTAVLVFALTLLAISAQQTLTPIMVGSDYSLLVTKGISPTICIFSLIALALLWPRLRKSTLDLWLFVVMCVWLCDVILSAVIGSSRFDLGWYGGRSFGLLAASFLLVILLLELLKLYDNLAERTAQLQSNESRLRSILETSHLYQGLLAVDGSVLHANATALRGIRATLADVAGRPFWETAWFSATDGVPEIVRKAVSAVVRGDTVETEMQLRLPTGNRWFDFAMRPIFNDEAAVVALVAEAVDVSERRQAEAALRHSQKMEAIGQLTGGVAHDFNNLLMVISGGLSILDRHPDHQRRQRILDGMRRATERGASLSRQLLTFSRRQPLKAEAVDLHSQIAGMRELLDRTLRGNVQFEMRLAPDLWPIMVDPTVLELVVLNLCVNARDAMPDGGTIILHAENAPDVCQEGLSGDFVCLTISDTGTGMAPAVLAHVFEPFFTTKDVGKGSGLGLAQVYGFAQQSSGSVHIDSKVGSGTTITLLLPRTQAPPLVGEQKLADFSTKVPACSDSGTVLLVEDEDEVAALVTEMLQQLGFLVTRTASAEAALGALANGRIVDLMFSDVMMPGTMNGVDLAREVRRRRPELPILLTSGYAEAAVQDAEVEGIGLLRKPYDLDSLNQAVRRALLDQASSPQH
jgi:PAS domain S-box-containing protein